MTEAEFYGVYYEELLKVEKNMLERVGRMLDSLGTDSETALAEHIKHRIKSPESAAEKLVRLGLSADAENAVKKLSDVVGLRVVTHFVGDIYTVLELIKREPSWRIAAVKDYIASPKPNGYRSLHVILTLPFLEGEINTEIQLRTIAMDCWASLEHQLKYKKSIKNTALIEEELKRCADEMASTDLTMQTIRDLIKRD